MLWCKNTNDYLQSTSVSKFIAKLGWLSLADRPCQARLWLFYKAYHGSSGIFSTHLRKATHQSRNSSISTFITIPVRLDCFKYSFFPLTVHDWNDLQEFTRVTLQRFPYQNNLHCCTLLSGTAHHRTTNLSDWFWEANLACSVPITNA